MTEIFDQEGQDTDDTFAVLCDNLKNKILSCLEREGYFFGNLPSFWGIANW